MARFFESLLLIVIIVVLFGGSFLFWEDKLFVTQIAQSAAEEDSLELLFVGDIMLDRGVEAQIKKNNDWRWPFLKIANTLQKADLVFGNLESQISDKGEKIGTIYSFRAKPAAVESLIYAGFDVISVTNNHSFDYGKEALDDSIHRLKIAGIATSPVTKMLDETTISFLAYKQWELKQSWQDDIKNATGDIVVVSIHAGEEYSKEPTIFQKNFAKDAIEAGADLVVGHHPHVTQPVEQYKNGWIAYSLGNFVFDQDFSAETMQGLMLKVLVEDKKIKEVISLQTIINSSFQTELLDKSQI